MKYIFMLLGIAVLFTLLNKNSGGKQHMSVQHTGKILAFGDSLTYGFGAPAHKSYPSVLARKTGRVIINAGINGETSSDGLRRLPTLLKDSSIKLMILCFGGNDILQKVPKTQLKAHLKQMITMAQQKGIAVLLISVPDIGLFGLSPLPLYEEVADETGVALLSGMLAEILAVPALKSDQIHPNASGYSKMAETLYIRLKEEGWI